MVLYTYKDKKIVQHTRKNILSTRYELEIFISMLHRFITFPQKVRLSYVTEIILLNTEVQKFY